MAVVGEGKAGLVGTSEVIPHSLGAISVKEAGIDVSKSRNKSEVQPNLSSAGTSAQIPKAVYVRYRDHAFFRNVTSPAAEPVEREAVGWIKEETEEVLLIECDRPRLQGCSGFNGVVVVKNCVISLFEVPLMSVFSLDLNCAEPKKKGEYALSDKESEKLSSKGAKKQ